MPRRRRATKEVAHDSSAIPQRTTMVLYLMIIFGAASNQASTTVRTARRWPGRYEARPRCTPGTGTGARCVLAG